ncbi:MAG: hypothetical protein JNK48_32815, partial [Bryobacterales bacterium]|nr:hypothetical protein [Bryobacterales bacterium]
MRLRGTIFAMLLLAPAAVAGETLADASRGAKVLAARRCLSCHAFDKNAAGQHNGPLAKLRRTQLKPAQLVGALWGHLPTMSHTAGNYSLSFGGWTSQESRDLLAWFAAAGYFEPAGDVRTGAALFQSQGCAACHPLVPPNPPKPGNGETLPIDRWTTLHDPIGLLHAVWKHAPSMRSALDHKTMNWPSLSVSEFADLLAFVHSRKPSQPSTVRLSIGDPDKGKAIFAMKGCASCHARMPALREAGLLHSFTELTAVFWNHAPMMTSLPASLSRDEIADVVAHLWVSRYFEDAGNVVRGRAVFERKRCVACHQARSVAGGSAVALIGA